MRHPEEADKAVIDNLKHLGDNLEESRDVSFYLYFEREYNAYSVAAVLANYLFNTEVSYCDYSSQWLCLASKKMKITTERLIEIGNWLEQLTAQHDGEYDGWETMVVENENNKIKLEDRE